MAASCLVIFEAKLKDEASPLLINSFTMSSRGIVRPWREFPARYDVLIFVFSSEAASGLVDVSGNANEKGHASPSRTNAETGN
jgi:hypothetical protein